MARRGGRYIAGALNLIGGDCLYGRNWGAIEHHPFLHFEVCYYQAIDYAIAHGLRARRGRRPGRAQARARLPAGARPTRRTRSPIRHCAAPSPTISRSERVYIAAESEELLSSSRRFARTRRWRKSDTASPCVRARRLLFLNSACIEYLDAGPSRLAMIIASRTVRAREMRMPGYDTNNIFAKILRGELPSHKVYEDTRRSPSSTSCLAARSHARLPKTPARNVLDASPAQLTACLKTVQKVAAATMKAFGASGITLQQFNEASGGQVVFHLHFHVLPRWKAPSMGPPAGKVEKTDVLVANAERSRLCSRDSRNGHPARDRRQPGHRPRNRQARSVRRTHGPRLCTQRIPYRR